MGSVAQSLGMVMGLLAITTTLAAQTLPVPTLPPPPIPPAAPAVPGKTPGEGEVASPWEETQRPRPRPWEYALGAGVRWDSNIDFVVPNGPSGTAIAPRGALARVFWGPRGQLRASGAGVWTGYPRQPEFSRYDADVRLKGDYRTSPASAWQADASYAFGYSDSSWILAEQGVPLPLVKMRSLAADLGLAQKLGARTSLRVDGRLFRTEFDAPGFQTGMSARGTLGLERRLGARDSLAIVYSLEDVLSDTAGRSYLTHFGSLQWNHVLSLRDAFLLEAGASHTPDAVLAGLDHQESFFGGATFTRKLGRSRLIAYVRREVLPAFGLGVSLLETRAGVQADIPMGRVWRLSLLGYHARPDASSTGEQLYSSSTNLFAALSRRLGARFALSGQVRYRSRGQTTTLASINATEVGFYVLFVPPGGANVPGFDR